MGIQNLNSYLRKYTTDKAINKITLKELSGKKIVVDTSIYLYRFISEDALLENMYIMISLFKLYNIVPIFVFDGIAPIDKNKTIEKRNNEKLIAEEEYNKLKKESQSIDSNDKRYLTIMNTMEQLKKKFIRLKREDFRSIQELITAFGLKYIEAEGEADELCAKLVIKKYAYACLSEDMDMFIYGCPRVLRYFSLMNESVIIYYLEQILLDLDLSFNEFKEICIISGTDYSNSINSNNINLYKTFEYFKVYKTTNNSNANFYEWLENNSDYINNIYKLYSIYNIFKTDNINLKKIKINIKIQEVNIRKVEEIMKPEGFIFIK